MRTTITLPDALLGDLLKHTHTKKPTKAVLVALDEWLRMKKIQEIKKLRGKLSIEDNLMELRKKEIKKIRNLND